MSIINKIVLDDCLDYLKSLPDNSVDMVFTSPPYEDKRKYNIDFSLQGEEWVQWSIERFEECYRVSKGLVVWVIDGKTKNFRWSATPTLFMADLHRRGIKLRKPPIFYRNGIPGSGGTDWWRNDYEFCVCASKGKLPWSDPKALGHDPKYGPGGIPSHRLQDGSRVNCNKKKTTTSGYKNGDAVTVVKDYNPPKKTNPGNVIHCTVGGGKMGSKLAHENEAPFPESLAYTFIVSFCPQGGLVLDPFCGSGTTCSVAIKTGRNYLGIDNRESQVDLTKRRTEEVKQTPDSQGIF